MESEIKELNLKLDRFLTVLETFLRKLAEQDVEKERISVRLADLKEEIQQLVEDFWSQGIPTEPRAIGQRYGKRLHGLSTPNQLIREMEADGMITTVTKLNGSKLVFPYGIPETLASERLLRFREFGLSELTVERLRELKIRDVQAELKTVDVDNDPEFEKALAESARLVKGESDEGPA